MKRGKSNGKWTLGDVVDFESFVGKPALWKKSWRSGVRDEIESGNSSTEKQRRRLGLRQMLEDVRSEGSVGSKVTTTTRLVGLGLAVVMFLVGVGVVRGLLTDFSYQEVKFAQPIEGEDVSGVDYAVSLETVSRKAKGFNVWIFLAVAHGVQWCFLVVGFLGYWLRRKWSGALTVLESGLVWVIRKMSGGKMDPAVWSYIKSRVQGGKSVFGWRLTRLLQAGGVGYNLGLLVGLFGCLWFLNVGYYWETTLPQFGEESLNKVTRVLSIPTGENFPGERAVRLTKIGHEPDTSDFVDVLAHSMPLRQRINLDWSIFFFVSLALYGLLPRLLMWLGSCWMERRALATLDFQEAHHRELWREVTKVERGEVRSGPSDGVVVLDIGGLEMETEQLRPFFLQEMRVNPEARFSLGTLDEAGEKKALTAARDAAMGVVFLVEGWNLSPKQMAIYHAQVRESIGPANMIRYVVLGSVEELKQWAGFVDNLKDSEAEVFHYQAS